MKIRPATPSDARHLAFLVNAAGEGLPALLWRRLAEPGQDPLEVGARRALREEGAFSYRNARVLEIEATVAGMVLGYRLPDPYDFGDLDEHPAVVRPLLELEAEVAGSWYINAIATYEKFRGRGVATALLSACEDIARAENAWALSLIVASANPGARALYARLGFEEAGSRPLAPYPGGPAEGLWLLMVKRLG